MILQLLIVTSDDVCSNYLINNKIATAMLNPTPSFTEQCFWIPETSDNVVRGLDSVLTYLSSQYSVINTSPYDLRNVINYNTQNSIAECK